MNKKQMFWGSILLFGSMILIGIVLPLILALGTPLSPIIMLSNVWNGINNFGQQNNAEYWNQMALTENLVHKLNIHPTSLGRGHLAYKINNTEYAIICKNYVKGVTSYSCCKEGEVDFKVRYDWDTITFLNVTSQDDCYEGDIK